MDDFVNIPAPPAAPPMGGGPMVMTDATYTVPPRHMWMYELHPKPMAEDDDDDDEEKEQKPYCYLCEVSAVSAKGEPNEYHQEMMRFAHQNMHQLEPEYLCECIERYYANHVQEHTLHQLPFLKQTVFDHLTRHEVNPKFTRIRARRVAEQYDDMYCRTMYRKDMNGDPLPPSDKNVDAHLKVLKFLIQVSEAK